MKRLLLIPMAIFFSSACLALNADRDEPINIQADSARVDEKSGISTYTGNVQVDQGTLKIRANEVKVHSEDKTGVTRIVANAADDSEKLAHYEQLPDNAELVEASARTIIYFVTDDRLELNGAARLKQTADRSFTGETIYYYIDEGRVNAEGGRTTTTFKRQPR